MENLYRSAENLQFNLYQLKKQQYKTNKKLQQQQQNKKMKNTNKKKDVQQTDVTDLT